MQHEGVYLTNEARTFAHSGRATSLRTCAGCDAEAAHDARRAIHEADTSNYDILVANRTMVNAQYDTNSDGTPRVTLLPGSNVDYDGSAAIGAFSSEFGSSIER